MIKWLPKQKAFADEYLIDMNATRAYKAVYKNVKTDAVAGQCGSRMLKLAKVKAYIDERLKKVDKKAIADLKEIMEYYTSVIRGESESDVVVVEGIGDGCSKAKSIKKKPDEKEKLKAAEQLCKRLDLMLEKQDHSLYGVVNINLKR